MYITRRFNGDYLVAVDNEIFVYTTMQIVNYLFNLGYKKVTDKEIKEWLTNKFMEENYDKNVCSWDI